MSPEVSRLLELLAERSLLSERKLLKLRQQLEEKRKRGKSVPLEALAKLLVERGHLTQRQANSLINEIAEEGPFAEAAEDELMLRPLEEEEIAEDATEAAPIGESYRSESELLADDAPFADAGRDSISEPKSRQRGSEPSGVASAPSAAARDQAASQLEDLPVSARLGAEPRRPKRNTARSEWESPLILAGGGGLLLLLLIGTLVWYLLRTDTAAVQLRAARDAYVDGAYAQAVQSYEAFLESHSDHDEASAARVHLSLARLRRSLESGAAPSVLLEQAQREIARIEQEPAFSEAGRELAAILPTIAAGLANEAGEAETPDAAAALSAKTQEALALLTNTKYVPISFRPTETIEDVERTLESVQRRQARRQALSVALADMQQAREEQSFQHAYAVHADLIRSYPDVADLPEVRDAVTAIAQAEATELRFQEETRPASSEDHGTASVETILLSAGKAGANASEGTGSGTAFVRIDGSVYGVDVASGEPLWRRFVGHADWPPLPTGNGDALAIDTEHAELVRLAGRDGKLVWRQSVGEVVGNAVVHDERVLVPTAEARLLAIDLATGELQGLIQFAQPLATTPTVDRASGRVIAIGEQSILYLLAADGLRGEDAVFVGHAAGSVRVPAAVVEDTVFIAENFAASRSRLHALSSARAEDVEGEAQPAALTKRIEPIRLTGRVTTPLATDGRRLALVTDLGEVRVLDVTGGGDGAPVSPVASRDAGSRASSEHYLVLREGELWLAADRLMRLKVLATGGRLQAADLPRVYAGDAFVHPLLEFGDRLIHVRRPEGQAGYLLAATSIRTGEQLWERELAAPATDLSVLPAGSGLGVATAGGRLYVLNTGLNTGSVDDASPSAGLASQDVTPDGIAAIVAGERWFVVESLQGEIKLHTVSLQDGELTSYELNLPGEIAAASRAFGDGILSPLKLGQVFWTDASDGSSLAAPFQPPLDPRRLPDWTPAAAVEPGQSFVIADRGRHVYLVEVERQDEVPWLRLAAESPSVPAAVTGELCVLPSLVLAPAGSAILRYRLPKLTADPAIELDRSVAWGPIRVGESALVATSDNRLHCLDGEGRVVAAASLSAPVVGRPLVLERAAALIALEDGSLLQVDAATGTTESRGTLGQPLATGPVRLNGHLYLGTADGALLRQPWTAPVAVAAALD